MTATEDATENRMPGRGADINRHLLTRLRVAHGWSQERLADEAGIVKSSISRFESGKRRPTPEMAAKLAAALGVEVGDLLAQ